MSSVLPNVVIPEQPTRQPVILFQLWKLRNIVAIWMFCVDQVLLTELIMPNIFVIIGVIVVIIAILSFLGLR
jgi:hypothetical protein